MRCFLVSGAMALMLAGCAPLSPEGSASAPTTVRPCFNVDQVVNFRAGGPDQLYVRTRLDRSVYALEGVGCRDLDFAIQLGLAPDRPGGRRVCVGDPVRVVNPSAGPGLSSCRARVERALSSTEIEALPADQRP